MERPVLMAFGMAVTCARVTAGVTASKLNLPRRSQADHIADGTSIRRRHMRAAVPERAQEPATRSLTPAAAAVAAAGLSAPHAAVELRWLAAGGEADE